MKILFRNELGKLVRYDGAIEVLGQGNVIRNNHVEGHHVTTAGTYDYIRFIDTDGSIKMLPRLTAYNLVDSYLKPGFTGALYVFEPEDKKERGAVLAMVSNGRRADDIADFIVSMQASAATIKRLKRAAYAGLLLGVVTMFFVIGYFILFYAFLTLYRINKVKRKLNMVPSAEELRSIIESDTRQLYGEPIAQQ